MCRQNALQLLPCQLAASTHVQALKELGDLQIKRLTTLLSVELRNLPLDFLHHLDLTLEEFCKTADSIVACFGAFAALQRFLCLPYFV